jgi:hypothetical protein
MTFDTIRSTFHENNRFILILSGSSQQILVKPWVEPWTKFPFRKIFEGFHITEYRTASNECFLFSSDSVFFKSTVHVYCFWSSQSEHAKQSIYINVMSSQGSTHRWIAIRQPRGSLSLEGNDPGPITTLGDGDKRQLKRDKCLLRLFGLFN